MAKYRGIVKIHGKIDDLSFYESNGKAIVKRASALSREKIMNDENFRRTRENMSEFAGSAVVAKAFRESLAQVMRTMGGKHLVGRLTGLMRKVCELNLGVRGQRDFEIVTNKIVLEGYNITADASFTAVFSAPYQYASVASRDQATLTIADFNTLDFLDVPQGANHFRFVNAITVLSNYSVNPVTGKYEPTDAALNQLHDVAYSAMIPIGGMVGSTTTLTATLPGSPAMTASAGLIGCVGVEFYQVIGTTPYLLAAGNAMRLERVF